MQGIRIAIQYVGARLDIALITIAGYVDTTTCQELTKAVQNLMDNQHFLMIADLGGVSYISSAGWGVFVGELKNIRDKGGDLKIVQMGAEVYEVFEMLEFNRILNYYDTLEEAINEFDILRGIDITQVDETKRRVAEAAPKDGPLRNPIVIKEEKRDGKNIAVQPTIPVRDFPLIEKIKMLVIENPFINTKEVCRALREDKYGNVKISRFRMRSLLRKLNLETREKRYRFYRSR